MSESAEPSESIGSIDEPCHEEDDDIFSDEEINREDEKDLGKNIAFFIFAGGILVFLIWLYLGVWWYLQQMSYGHG